MENVKALVGAFNQEKALLEAFSVIVKTDGSFAALIINVLAAVKSGPILYLFPTPVSVLWAAAPRLDIK